MRSNDIIMTMAFYCIFIFVLLAGGEHSIELQFSIHVIKGNFSQLKNASNLLKNRTYVKLISSKCELIYHVPLSLRSPLSLEKI